MDAAAEIGRNPVSKHQPIRFSLSVETERADAGRNGRTSLGRLNSHARTGTGKHNFTSFSLPHARLATLLG